MPRSLLTTFALGLLLFTAGCRSDMGLEDLMGATAPISAASMAEITRAGFTAEDPVLVRIFKEESELEVWKRTSNGSFVLFKTYPMCAWSGVLGPKKKEGDRQAPEGFYDITRASLNPKSAFHLAVNMGFPNAHDRANGFTGSNLMIHGSCSSSGCYAMDNGQIEEIYALVRHAFEAGQRSLQIQAFPFRMSPENMARHRNNPAMPFWRNLKKGYDRFDIVRRPVTTAVCEREYFFGDLPKGSTKPSAAGSCPEVVEHPMLLAHREAEERKEAEIVAAMKPSDFAVVTSFAYGAGQGLSPEAYAREQNRRPGYDRHGNKVDSPTSAFRALLTGKP